MKVLKILLLGDHGSGKTSFIIRYISGYFLEEEDLPHSRAVDFFQKNIEIEGVTVQLDFWDFGPEERFRFLLQQYSKKTSGAIYVCDITNSLSLDHIPDWVHSVREYRGRVPILLIGNKLDLKEKRAFKYSAVRKALERYDLFDYVELSTKTGENFDNVVFQQFWKEVNKPVTYPSDIKYTPPQIEKVIPPPIIPLSPREERALDRKVKKDMQCARLILQEKYDKFQENKALFQGIEMFYDSITGFLDPKCPKCGSFNVIKKKYAKCLDCQNLIPESIYYKRQETQKEGWMIQCPYCSSNLILEDRECTFCGLSIKDSTIQFN